MSFDHSITIISEFMLPPLFLLLYEWHSKLRYTNVPVTKKSVAVGISAIDAVVANRRPAMSVFACFRLGFRTVIWYVGLSAQQVRRRRVVNPRAGYLLWHRTSDAAGITVAAAVDVNRRGLDSRPPDHIPDDLGGCTACRLILVMSKEP
eukprot:scaffold47491_cov31-Prasinocladus_malaysianus.AAC.1